MNARSHLALCVSLAIAVPASAQVGTRTSVPVAMPERPFLLVDAERRFRPSEPAQVRLQLRDGGELDLTLFRVHVPSVLLGQAGARQGVSVAATAIGEEAEALIARGGATPRRGTHLTLVQETRVSMPRVEAQRRVHDEAVVYDSNEDVEENVATYWVASEGWSVRRVALGRLPAGLYLVQARGAAWVGSALLSVGELVVIARRGDREDVVRVTDSEGAPHEGVRVSALGDGPARVRTTGSDGIARFPPSDAESLRFRADRGADVAWTDVAHVRLSPCDARVYVATGRPMYRRGEIQYLRGHVRGCARSDGRFGPLAQQRVTLRSGEHEVSATTDADGNFVAQLPADGEIIALLDGREHRREVRIDHRALPLRTLVVRPDRPWAASGEIVHVTVSDDDGGWPHGADVVLDTPAGRLVSRIGPGQPASFDVRVPATTSTFETMTLHASLASPGRITMASADLAIGRSPIQLELDAEATQGASDESFALEARASDLGGRDVEGPIRFEVFGSDGNRATGEVRYRGEGSLRRGRAPVRLPLIGRGPWMIRASHAGAEAELVVWSRARPPQLSPRGDLAILPRANEGPAGGRMGVDVRVPAAGAAWLTVEQGGVLYSTPVRSVGRVAHLEVPLPDAARGLASMVLTHVHAGRVRTASATVEIETSMPVTLDVSTDRVIYGPGASARVAIEAKTREEQPRDAVISLWLADVGYWGMGEDEHPMPGDYFRLPGRPASGGDSQTPVAYGSEEGRRIDSELVLDGQRVDGATFRHAWRYGGDVVSFTATGRLQMLAERLAHAARLSGAVVRCEEDTEHHSLRARMLPWDLVAVRLADHAGGTVWIDDRDRLVIDCHGGGGAGMGTLGGSGLGSGYGRGAGGLRGNIREERLEGTLHFVGLQRLGPDGRIELDVPLPDHPGRWRIEVLAIADDGGGARAHESVQTRDGIDAWIDVPRSLRPGDRVDGVLRVESYVPGARAQVSLQLPPEVRLEGTMPTEVALVEGRAAVPLSLVGIAPGTGPIVLEARVGAVRDAVRATLEVEPPSTEMPLYYGAVIGAHATEMEVPLPELAQPASLTIELDPSLEGEAAHLLDALSQPRWDLGVMRADRLASLSALRRVVARVSGPPPVLLRAELDAAIEAELSALRALSTSTGEIGWGDFADPGLTLEVLELVPVAMASDWTDARHHVLDRLRRGELRGEIAARAVRVLDREALDAPAILRAALSASGGDPRALTQIVLAASARADRAVERQAAGELVQWIEARIAEPTPPTSCAGWAWYLCFARRGERGTLARAVLALQSARHPRAPELRSRVGEWLARQPLRTASFVWGSDEADVLELLASGSPGQDAVEAWVDGRRVPLHHGRVRVPAGAHRVVLRFAERRDRLRRVAVRGLIEAEAPPTTRGNVQLARRFDERDGEWRGIVTFVLPERGRDVVLEVPLPAGLTVDHRQLARHRAAIVDGSLRVSFDELAPGAHTVQIPLLVTGAGSFVAGPAHLRAGEGELVGVTPASRIDVTRAPTM